MGGEYMALGKVAHAGVETWLRWSSEKDPKAKASHDMATHARNTASPSNFSMLTCGGFEIIHIASYRSMKLLEAFNMQVQKSFSALSI
jgi:hypothetical protein